MWLVVLKGYFFSFCAVGNLLIKKFFKENEVKFCVDLEHLNVNAQVFDLELARRTDLLTSNTSPSIYFFEGSALGLSGKLEKCTLQNIVGNFSFKIHV